MFEVQSTLCRSVMFSGVHLSCWVRMLYLCWLLCELFSSGISCCSKVLCEMKLPEIICNIFLKEFLVHPVILNHSLECCKVLKTLLRRLIVLYLGLSKGTVDRCQLHIFSKEVKAAKK